VSQQPEHPRSAVPTIGVSIGDPGGIGPEVLVKALADDDLRRTARWVVYGSRSVLDHAARVALHTPPRTDRQSSDPGITIIELITADLESLLQYPARASAEGGKLSMACVERAIADALKGEIDAIVTGPINKAAWFLAGFTKHPGHTELLADRCGVTNFGMMFQSSKLNVILATAHVPLMSAAARLSIAGIERTIALGNQAMRDLGVASPRIAVCGLNPHAGEGGLFGDEDTRLIAPAIQNAKAAGIDASGPYPADTIFNAAVAGKYDLVVAMYHDQGLIPLKLLARDQAVNMTVGLPIVRTSPDHGTAYDIAGKNIADPGSMKAAMALAVRLAKVRAGRDGSHSNAPGASH
jgi:4-hydroxythreonine-4-phosphate dehydrogenase